MILPFLSKKAQVSIFIITGMIILLFIAALVYTQKQGEFETQKKQVSKTENGDSVSLFVTACLQKEMENGLIVLSSQGGYYHLPPQSFESSEGLLPYYFNTNNSMQRSLSQKTFEEQLGLYILDNLPNCFRNFSSFPEKKISIISEEKYADIFADISADISADVTLSNEGVITKLSYPLVILDNNKKESLQFFTTIIPVNALKLIEVSKQYLDAQMKNQEGIPLDSVVYLKEKYDISLSVLFIEENAILTFSDETIKVENTPLSFRFAVKYNVTRQNVSEE